MLDPISSTDSAGAIQARGRGSGRGLNRVKDGLTMGTLRATSGSLGGVSRSSGLVRAESSRRSGRRSSSLYDLSTSGDGVLARMGGQTRSTSPLTALHAGNGSSSGSRRLSSSHALQAQMRSGFERIDGRGRFLRTQANPQRVGSGFGVQIMGHGFSRLG